MQKIRYLDANKILYKTAKTTVVSPSGMIRFAKMTIFSGVQKAFPICKAIISGRFSC